MLLKSPPDVPGHWLLGNLVDFQSDTLGFLENATQYGDIVSLRFGPLRGYFVNHPDAIHQILSAQSQLFRKPSIVKRALADITGKNIFTGNDDFWKHRRKLMQPAFHAQHISSYADTMIECTLQELATWQDNEILSLDIAMTRLTMTIIIKTMFGADISEKTQELGIIFAELFQLVYGRMSWYALLPSWLPTSANRRVHELTKIIREIIQSFIHDRRLTGENKNDLLSMLMSATDENEQAMSDEDILREALTIFGAGYETTAYAITFACYALTQNSEISDKLYNEVHTVLGEKPIKPHDLLNLPYSELVIKEALRLYPTAWGFSRSTIEDVEIAGYAIPKNSTILISPWTLGRDGRWFEDPLCFNPDRHLDSDYPRYAFVPFGGGARVCIGNQFSMMEARIIIATIVQQYQLSLKPNYDTQATNIAFTLRPHNGMDVYIQKRK